MCALTLRIRFSVEFLCKIIFFLIFVIFFSSAVRGKWTTLLERTGTLRLNAS